MDDATSGVQRGTHYFASEIEPLLSSGEEVRLGRDTWRVITIDDMRQRAGLYSRAVEAMARGENIPEDALPDDGICAIEP